MRRLKTIWRACLASLVSGWLASVALAEDSEKRRSGGPERNPLSPWYLSDSDRKWNFDALVGMELEPDYIGSDDSEVEPAGFLRAHLRDRRGNRYTFGFEEIGAVFYPGENWAFGVDIENEEGRESENEDLQGLPDGETTLEGEFSLYRRFGDSYATAIVQVDLLGRDKGNIFFLAYAYDYLAPSGRWLFSPRIDVSWGDAEHMQTEFGLTETQAAIIGQQPYSPGGGLKSATAGFLTERNFGRRWSVLGSLEVEHYFSKAADSPLIAVLGSDVNVEATLGVLFRF